MERTPGLSPEEAIRVLKENLEEIDRVSEWAEACSYENTKKFSRQFRNLTGRRPREVMIEIKVKRAINLLSNGAGLSNYEIALQIGKRDEQALFHFIKGQTGKAPEFFKRKKSYQNLREKNDNKHD